MTTHNLPITRAQLRRAADSGSWDRGVGYHQQGRAELLFEDNGVIRAKVAGTRNYKVRLWVEDGETCGECSCPMGDAGVFCKHLVAVGLTYLKQGAENLGGKAVGGKSSRQAHDKPRVTLDDVRQYLARQATPDFIEIIMQQVEDDDRLRERLLMRVAHKGAGGLDVATYRKAIDRATNTGGFVDYGSAYDFARGIHDVIEEVAELLEEGHAAECVDLAEHALERCEAALGGMDDSDGHMQDIFERLVEIHHEACLAAKPDSEALARRLFEWELEGDWDTFAGACERYADVLGEKGLAAYRELAQRMWARMPALRPGERGGFDSRRYHLTAIMESLARQDGNLDTLIAVKNRDLSVPYRYLDIASTYKEAGQLNEALEWAEKGVQAFPGQPDERLVDFLAAEYHRRRRHGEAMDLIWNSFTRQPQLDSYTHLKDHADRCKQWPAWREKALAHIRSRLQKGKPRPGTPDYWGRRSDRSLLVEIFLWEKDAEAAWQEATSGGCSEELWMRLARAREKERPADAVPIHQRQIDHLADRRNNNAYREAASLIRKIRTLMGRMGQEKQFADYLAAVRQNHKPKRNFMAMLERLG